MLYTKREREREKQRKGKMRRLNLMMYIVRRAEVTQLGLGVGLPTW